MADWVALAGIGSTAVVAVSAQVISALTRRGDREHESALDFQRRAWEAKSAALTEAIDTCRSLKREATGAGREDGYSQPLRRAAVIMAFQDFGFSLTKGGSSALLAYGSDSVTDPAEQLLELLENEFNNHADHVLTVLHYRDQKKAALDLVDTATMDQDDLYEAATARREERDAEIALGAASSLDLCKVQTLCDEIIAAAKKDLRGT